MFKFSKKFLFIFLIIFIVFSGFWLVGVKSAEAAAKAAILNQTQFRWRNDNGDETTATWRQEENINDSQSKTLKVRLRIAWDESNGAKNSGNTDITPLLEYKLASGGDCLDAAGWTTLTTGSTEFVSATSTYYTEPVLTTQQLTIGARTFLDGELLEQSNPASIITMSRAETEHEWNFQVTESASEVAYIFRVSNNGTGFNNYNNCPQLTVTAIPVPTVSCSTDVASTAFGTLDSALVTTSTPNASTTMSCSDTSLGCTLYINDIGTSTLGGGLWSDDASDFIESPNAAFAATTTLQAGTEGYGIRAATTTVGSGATLTLAQRYNVQAWLSGSPQDVGGLTTTTLTLASSTADVTDREVVVTHKATIAEATPIGTYDDTITYSCILN